MTERFDQYVKYFLLLGLGLTVFLFSSKSEQSPFELIKLLAYTLTSVMALVYWTITRFKSSECKINWNTALLLQLFILLCTALSAVFSKNKFNSFWGNYNIPTDGVWSILICLFFTFLFLQYFSASQEIKKIGAVLIAGGCLLGFYGIIQHFGYDPVNWWGYQQLHLNAYGTIGQAVGFATIVACLLPLACVYYFHQVRSLLLFLFSVILFVMMLGLLYSGSRTPVFLGLSGVVFFSVLQFVKPFSLKPLKKAIALAVILLSALTVHHFDPNNSLAQKLQSEAVNTGVSERMQVWQGAFEIWQKYPVLGAGPETFALELKLVNKKDFNTNQNWGLYWHKAHNHIMHYLATIGLLGLSAHLLLLFYALYRLYVLIRLPKWGELELIRISLIAGYGLIFIGNMTAFYFITTQLYAWLFLILEAMLAQDVRRSTFRSPKYLAVFNATMLTALLIGLSYQVGRYALGDFEFSKSRMLLEQKRNLEGAMAAIDKAIIYNPDDCRFYLRKASILTTWFKIIAGQKQNLNRDEAIKIVDEVTKQAINCEPENPESWLYRGKLFEELFAVGVLSNSNLIGESILQGQKFAPVNPVYPYYLGLYYLRIGQVGMFLEQMYKAIDLKADYIPAYSSLIDYFYNTQNQKEVNRLVSEISKTKLYSGEFLAELNKLMKICLARNDHANVVEIGRVYEKYAKIYLNKF